MSIKNKVPWDVGKEDVTGQELVKLTNHGTRRQQYCQTNEIPVQQSHTAHTLFYSPQVQPMKCAFYYFSRLLMAALHSQRPYYTTPPITTTMTAQVTEDLLMALVLHFCLLKRKTLCDCFTGWKSRGKKKKHSKRTCSACQSEPVTWHVKHTVPV